MNNFDQFNETSSAGIGIPQEGTAAPAKRSKGGNIMSWWHSFANPPEPPKEATVMQREKYRRARSVSTVVFFFLALMIIGIPATLTLPDQSTFWAACSIGVALIIAPFFNRAGHVLVAGLLVILSLQFTIMFEVLIVTPSNETALQIYDLFLLAILLSLVILPMPVTWVIAGVDCVFIVLDLFYQPHTATFVALLNHEGMLTILLRPIILILFITSVSSFLLTSVAKAVRQSYEAEFIANIEHAAAQQNEAEAEQKRELEESIQQIVQAHTDTMNGRLRERIPYPQAKILWPLVGILNTLWTRLLRSQQREQELAQIQQDITAYNELLQRSIQSPQQPLMPYPTRTALSPLIMSVARLHQALLNNSSRTSMGRMDRDIF